MNDTSHPSSLTPHLLQSPLWGQFKAGFGWEPEIFRNESAQAQVLFRRLPLGLSIAYLPKGPVGHDWESLWPQIDVTCKKHRAVFLQVEPDLAEGDPKPALAEQMQGFTVEPHTIQPRSTILVDLKADEEKLLSRMKQKTRYNIRLAEKKGVVVRETDDIQGFHRLMQTTGTRDGFAVHDISYYQKAFDIFSPSEACVLLGAFHDEQPLAYLMLFLSGERSWYFYGASDDASRNLMPTYLLQWEAMRWSKAHGATTYDLWGIPDASAEELEEQFMQRSDGLWGVYRFKRGFGGEVVRSAPAFVRVYKPLLYRAYQKIRAGRMAD
jgi:lipid II:glycine glycyltransferase (peptidoglycan interpeptide bridge formation enzyme)